MCQLLEEVGFDDTEHCVTARLSIVKHSQEPEGAASRSGLRLSGREEIMIDIMLEASRG